MVVGWLPGAVAHSVIEDRFRCFELTSRTLSIGGPREGHSNR